MAKIIQSAQGFFYADNAVIAGDVTLADQASVWFGAVIRGDVAPIRIGQRVNIQDHAVIHCDSGNPQIIEDDVSIGHSAIVHGQRVGCGTLIAMGAKILGRTTIGRHCIIAAGAVVPEGMTVPDGMVVMGVPGRIRREVSPEERQYIAWIAEHYVSLAQRWARNEFPPVL